MSFGWNRPTLQDQQSFSPEAVYQAGMRHHHIANTAYPIHHRTTVWPYRVGRSMVEAVATEAWRDIDHLGLYVHVPFCQARCKYCEYTVVDRSENGAEDLYFEALMREFELYRQALDTPGKTLIGFDIGGGTPSFATSDNIRRVIDAARLSFRWQAGMAISIETTPMIADRAPDKIEAFREMGIERISMGVQTTHFRLAQAMNREYEGLTMLERAVTNIRRAGFRRFNIDLMYGFADQSPQRWGLTVRQTIALEPEYITLYRVRHKGTRIRDQAARVTLAQVVELEEIAHDLLLAAGYVGSPGKNTYSKVPEDVGTSDYLTERVIKGTPYLGLGLGAQSLSHHTLSYNMGAASKSLAPYLRSVERGRLPIQDLYHLSLDAAMAKMIAVSFYFGQIHLDHFQSKFGVSLAEHFSREVAFVLERGYMAYAGPYLRLTPNGVPHFNGIVALFFSPAVKEYLLHLERPFAVGSVAVAAGEPSVVPAIG